MTKYTANLPELLRPYPVIDGICQKNRRQRKDLDHAPVSPPTGSMVDVRVQASMSVAISMILARIRRMTF